MQWYAGVRHNSLPRIRVAIRVCKYTHVHVRMQVEFSLCKIKNKKTASFLKIHLLNLILHVYWFSFFAYLI